MKTKEKKDVVITYLLCFFILIQPLIDILPLYEESQYQLFGFTIPTLTRCIFIGIFTIFILKKIKNFKYYIIYIILIIFYTVIHHLVVSNAMVLPDNYVYSVSQELFYIIRMLLPLIIIVFMRYNKVDYKKFMNTIVLSSLIISVIIIVGNTLCISYSSYGSGHTNVNWLHWLGSNLGDYTFEEMTSKGWFYMANQVSGIMILLLPFNMYDLITNKRKINVISTFLSILSMIMLGTRTSSYGWIIIALSVIIIYVVINHKMKIQFIKDKKIYPLVIISFIGLILLTISPITRRIYKYEIGNVGEFGDRPEIRQEDDMDDVYSYIEKVYPSLLIQKPYIMDVYNYKYDPQFWYDTFDLIIKNGAIDNRDNQLLISKRIMELNKYKLKYKLFGYSFSRMRNAGLYMEHDVIVQMFTMGLLGLILLMGPYVAIFIFATVKVVKKMKKDVSFINLIFIMSLGMVMIVSILTSHIFDELFVTIYLGFICGYFLNEIVEE